MIWAVLRGGEKIMKLSYDAVNVLCSLGRASSGSGHHRCKRAEENNMLQVKDTSGSLGLEQRLPSRTYSKKGAGDSGRGQTPQELLGCHREDFVTFVPAMVI